MERAIYVYVIWIFYKNLLIYFLLKSLKRWYKEFFIKDIWFTGFLGPDNVDLLDAVQKITSVFRLSHVTPLSFSSHQLETPYHVASFNLADKIKVTI
jgi:hypothetical protein